MMNQSEKGFTLVELLVAVVVGLLIMAAIYGMMNLSQGSSAGVDRRVMTQQDARAVLDLIAMEIGMASYNPLQSTTVFGTVPSTATTCNNIGLASALASRKGIQIANASNLLIAMDLNSDGLVGVCTCAGTCCGPPNDCADLPCAGRNEYISYAFNSANGTITRRVSCSAVAEAILGGAGSSSMVRNDAITTLFQYFDATSATPMAVPVSDANIPLIRRIRITIVADVEIQGERFKTSRRTYSTDVLVRNHVLSP